MAKYYDYISEIRASATEIVIKSTYGPDQISTPVVRDGSEETNFKAACWAHKQAFLSLPASSTSPACYVVDRGLLIASTASATVVTTPTTIVVPPGNSGVLVWQLDPITGTGTIEYKINSGSYSTLAHGGTVTVTNGQTITIRASTLAELEFINGSIVDQDTGKEIEVFSLMNSTPAP